MNEIGVGGVARIFLPGGGDDGRGAADRDSLSQALCLPFYPGIRAG